jgi:hypothetical protein
VSLRRLYKMIHIAVDGPRLRADATRVSRTTAYRTAPVVV